MSAQDDQLEASIKNILEQKTLKWIFVGGKGGVGKTTCSCSLAAQLSKVRERVLLISTDPAHNISDAFAQKFSKQPTAVNGFTNLFAMEIDSNPAGDGSEFSGLEEMLQNAAQSNGGGPGGPGAGFSMGKDFLQSFAGGLPGIDEAMSFAEMMKLIDTLDFDVVVFDTAPTGHTLRLLQFPTLLEKAFTKILSLQGMFGPMLNPFVGMMGGGANTMGDMMEKLTTTLEVVKKMNAQFKNPEYTTFVCVCIAEFLSLYETERLIQELTKQEIDTHNIIVNQLLFPDKDASGNVVCRKCKSRSGIQGKYLEEIDELYEDFHVIKLPLLETEVRGSENILKFSERLLDPELNSNTTSA